MTRRHFIDATGDAGPSARSAKPAGERPPDSLPVHPPRVATGDFNGDGADDLFASVWSPTERRFVTRLYLVERWRSQDITDKSALALPRAPSYAAVADFDNDGWLDLFVIGTDARGHLFRNEGKACSRMCRRSPASRDIRGSRRALFVDLDHDGDLDLLLVGGARTLVYRNNLDGTFTEVARDHGSRRPRASAHDAAFADFDDDGRIDLVDRRRTVESRCYRQHRRAPLRGCHRFERSAGDRRVDQRRGRRLRQRWHARPLHRRRGGAPELWRNDGTGKFARDTDRVGAGRAGIAWPTCTPTFVDFDNDGWLDLVAGR